MSTSPFAAARTVAQETKRAQAATEAQKQHVQSVFDDARRQVRRLTKDFKRSDRWPAGSRRRHAEQQRIFAELIAVRKQLEAVGLDPEILEQLAREADSLRR